MNYDSTKKGGCSYGEVPPWRKLPPHKKILQALVTESTNPLLMENIEMRNRKQNSNKGFSLIS